MERATTSVYVTDNRSDHRGQSHGCAHPILRAAATKFSSKHALIALITARVLKSVESNPNALVYASLASLRILLILSVK